MKPFLILQLRPIDLASDSEFEAILKYGGLLDHEAHRVRMEKEGIPKININDYSGIIIGGGPSNVSDDQEQKKEYQKRFEKDLNNLFTKVFEYDFPVLGVCYGIGAINKFRGGIVSKEKYSESVGAVEIELTKNSQNDDLLVDLPQKFTAYCGHKEACQIVPPDATVLASSKSCPVQMIRFKNNIYATQFHTELDIDGIILRVNVYKNHGYFSPEDAEILISKIKNQTVTIPSVILKRFVNKYKQEKH